MILTLHHKIQHFIPSSSTYFLDTNVHMKSALVCCINYQDNTTCTGTNITSQAHKRGMRFIAMRYKENKQLVAR